MTALQVCFLVGALVVVGAQTGGRDTDAYYYWREYIGEIPLDAVPAGVNEKGSKIFVGHTFHTFVNSTGSTILLIVPGQVDEADRTIYYSYDQVPYAEDRNIKILCSSYPEKFKWIKTNTEGIKFLRQRHLVQGGADDGYPLLIGRIVKDGRSSVGKVTLHYKYDGMRYVDVDNQKVYLVKSYEVLSYDDRCS